MINYVQKGHAFLRSWRFSEILFHLSRDLTFWCLIELRRKDPKLWIG